LDDSPEIARRGRFHPETAPSAAEGFVTAVKKNQPQSGAGFFLCYVSDLHRKLQFS